MNKIIISKKFDLIKKMEISFRNNKIKFWSYPLSQHGWMLIIELDGENLRFAADTKINTYKAAYMKVMFNYE